MAEHRWRSRYANSVSCTPTPQNGEDRRVLASVENYRPSNDTKGFHRSWEPSSRREIGALNENNVDRLTASEDHSSSYKWYCPEEPLWERRHRAENRREELLQLLYQEDVDTSHIEELVREWVSLVMERDRLLTEHVRKENCGEYFRDLRRLLKEQPSLGDGSEEVNIREALLDLERCVTQFCRKRNIAMTPEKPQITGSIPFSNPLKFHPPPPVESSKEQSLVPRLEFHQQHKEHVLDQETGQTDIHVVPGLSDRGDPEMDIESSGSLFKETKLEKTVPPPSLPVSSSFSAIQHQLPIADQLGKGTTTTTGTGTPNNSSSSNHEVAMKSDQIDLIKGCATNISIQPHLPPVSPVSPPPLPPSPPFHLSLLPMSPNHKVMRGALGTVQFAGMSFNTIPARQSLRLEEEKLGDMETDETDNKEMSEPSDSSSAPGNEKKMKNLMDEISLMGQGVLKRTDRPRSPGGTPFKASRNRLTLTDNTDVIQRALISKFRSLHSTPLMHSQHRHTPYDGSGSMDFSNAWSEINSSVMCDDPDISASNLSAFVSNQSMNSGGEGEGLRGTGGGGGGGGGSGGINRLLLGTQVGHNGSTAV